MLKYERLCERAAESLGQIDAQLEEARNDYAVSLS